MAVFVLTFRRLLNHLIVLLRKPCVPICRLADFLYTHFCFSGQTFGNVSVALVSAWIARALLPELTQLLAAGVCPCAVCVLRCRAGVVQRVVARVAVISHRLIGIPVVHIAVLLFHALADRFVQLVHVRNVDCVQHVPVALAVGCIAPCAAHAQHGAQLAVIGLICLLERIAFVLHLNAGLLDDVLRAGLGRKSAAASVFLCARLQSAFRQYRTGLADDSFVRPLVDLHGVLALVCLVSGLVCQRRRRRAVSRIVFVLFLCGSIIRRELSLLLLFGLVPSLAAVALDRSRRCCAASSACCVAIVAVYDRRRVCVALLRIFSGILFFLLLLLLPDFLVCVLLRISSQRIVVSAANNRLSHRF